MDNTIFWSPDDTKIDHTISELKVLDFDVTDEGVSDSFLSIKIDGVEYGTINISQHVLTQTIIDTLGLENDYKQHQTPAISLHLQKYEDSDGFDGN